MTPEDSGLGARAEVPTGASVSRLVLSSAPLPESSICGSCCSRPLPSAPLRASLCPGHSAGASFHPSQASPPSPAPSSGAASTGCELKSGLINSEKQGMVCTMSLCWVEIRQTMVGVGGFTLKAFAQPLKSLQVDSARFCHRWAWAPVGQECGGPEQPAPAPTQAVLICSRERW